jgi:Tfp pilus assembly protein PilZ
MAEKRGRERKRKRLKLRFGTEYPKRVAFTEDLSTGGLFIITAQPELPGTKLLLQITLPDEEEVIARGRVQWAKKVPANLVHIAKKGGMGVRITQFESGEQVFKKLITELRH